MRCAAELCAAEDPWNWRLEAAGREDVVYGKLFSGKNGFLSAEYLPLFACFRRDGYDFDARYECGLASARCKRIMDALEQHGPLPAQELKERAGFGRNGLTGFDGALAQLQMQTYVTVCGFTRKRNRFGAPYGWPVALYCTCEQKLGAEYVRSKYALDPAEAAEALVLHMHGLYPEYPREALLKALR